MINAFDVETFEKDKKLIPYCICLILNNKTRVFFDEDCVKEFINYLIKESKEYKRKKKKTYMFIFS